MKAPPPEPLRVLVVEDSEADAMLLDEELRASGFDPHLERVDSECALREALDRPWDVVLADYNVPGFGGLKTIAVVKERAPDLPVIVVSGSVGDDALVGAMRAGASDYVFKDNLSRLASAMRRELRDAEARRHRREAEQAAAVALREAQQKLQHVVSSSPAVLYSLRVDGQAFVGTWVSENVERLLGYSVEEALARDWWDAHLHPEDRERVLAELPRLLAAGHLAQEYRFRTRQGGYRWLRAELLLLRDTAGEPLEVIGSWT